MKILGWEIINPLKKDVSKLKALVPKDSDSGANGPSSGEAMSSYFSFDQNASYTNDIELISKYRNVTFIPEVDMAIEEIINEMIITSENEPVVRLDLDRLDMSDSFKDRVTKEFDIILNLLNFQNNAYDYAKRWYVDGRIFFHILIDMKHPKLGIQDIRQLDALNIKKVKEVDRELDDNQIPIIKEVREYFIYNECGIHTTRNAASADIRISTDSIAYSNSGIVDPDTGMVLSNLHKALKVSNHLSMVETAMVIYRLTRAPERRVFYIDTGDLPKQKAEEYLREQMNRHRNKLSYDVTTGQLIDQKSILSMMEDYWMPRRGGTRGTEITTLESGQNLQNLEDVIYFREKLYKALNVPLLRLQPDATTTYSKDSAIIREELKFARFIDKIRNKFAFFLYDLLRKQLILKGLITPLDWDRLKQYIFIEFQRDSFYSEIKETELISDRISLLNDMNQFVGVLFSNEYVYKKILKLTNDEVEEMQKQLKDEKENKKIKDGTAVNEYESTGFDNTDLDTDFDTTETPPSVEPETPTETPPSTEPATPVEPTVNTANVTGVKP